MPIEKTEGRDIWRVITKMLNRDGTPKTTSDGKEIEVVAATVTSEPGSKTINIRQVNQKEGLDWSVDRAKELVSALQQAITHAEGVTG